MSSIPIDRVTPTFMTRIFQVFAHFTAGRLARSRLSGLPAPPHGAGLLMASRRASASAAHGRTRTRRLLAEQEKGCVVLASGVSSGRTREARLFAHLVHASIQADQSYADAQLAAA